MTKDINRIKIKVVLAEKQMVSRYIKKDPATVSKW